MEEEAKQQKNKKNTKDTSKELNELGLINESLKICVDKLRKIMFLSHDQFNFSIISALMEVEGVSYLEDSRKDQIVFALPLTSISSQIIYPHKLYILQKGLILVS